MAPTRRALLRSASLGALALGGCLGAGSRGEDTETGSGATRGTDDDPTLLKVRNPGGEAAVVDLAVESDEDGGNDGGDGEPDGGDGEPDGGDGELDGRDDGSDGDADPAPIGRELVTTADRAAELTVAAGVADADRSRVRSFLDDTDYETETVFVARAGIRSCYRFRIRSVSWQPGHVEYEYCRELRPPDAACEADARDAVGLLFRLPAALDARLSGSGSSGHSPCRGVGTEYDRLDANATVPGNDTALGEGGDDGTDGDGTDGDGTDGDGTADGGTTTAEAGGGGS